LISEFPILRFVSAQHRYSYIINSFPRLTSGLPYPCFFNKVRKTSTGSKFWLVKKFRHDVAMVGTSAARCRFLRNLLGLWRIYSVRYGRGARTVDIFRFGGFEIFV
jgi:hypothetical protein